MLIKNKSGVGIKRSDGLYAYRVIQGSKLAANSVVESGIQIFNKGTCIGIRNNSAVDVTMNLVPVQNDHADPISIVIKAGTLFNEIAFDGFVVSGTANNTAATVLYYMY